MSLKVFLENSNGAFDFAPGCGSQAGEKGVSHAAHRRSNDHWEIIAVGYDTGDAFKRRCILKGCTAEFHYSNLFSHNPFSWHDPLT
jgi:hypothetical protein